MSIKRWAAKTDKSQPAIVEALRKAGWLVWSIGLPCDLLLFKPGIGFKTLECKTPYGKKSPKARVDKRQEEQIRFLAVTQTPIATTPEDALKAVGDIHAIA